VIKLLRIGMRKINETNIVIIVDMEDQQSTKTTIDLQT
jgi:hypothetical protein